MIPFQEFPRKRKTVVKMRTGVRIKREVPSTVPIITDPPPKVGKSFSHLFPFICPNVTLIYFSIQVAGHTKNTTDNKMRFETMLNALGSLQELKKNVIILNDTLVNSIKCYKISFRNYHFIMSICFFEIDGRL